mmetsp:Transcript_5264/g.8148  ORF Transcript_5264/g.8148 Transcript_5264/m.8148 type:complete len:134 (+) Transcript_5264:412-813(+)
MTKDRIAKFAKENEKRQQNKVRLQTEQKYFETELKEKAREIEVEDLKWKERQEKREKELVDKINISDQEWEKVKLRMVESKKKDIQDGRKQVDTYFSLFEKKFKQKEEGKTNFLEKKAKDVAKHTAHVREVCT